MRLDKYLSNMGIGTRKQVKNLIGKGRVRVNDDLAKKSNLKIDIDKDKVYFDDKLIIYEEFLYYMLNKPSGVVSATRDSSYKTVIDLIDEDYGKDLFPVGRLDIDTEGLLLITNDGQLAHKLLSPKNKVDKIYYAKINGLVTEEDKLAFKQGVDIGQGYITMPATLNILTAANISEVELTIHEGKFHQVKRMFQAVGKEVIYLKRISMASLKLDISLNLGQYRRLTDNELKELRKFQ
mgnify:CR=1 FL=1